jgi:hypothetical protein
MAMGTRAGVSRTTYGSIIARFRIRSTSPRNGGSGVNDLGAWDLRKIT